MGLHYTCVWDSLKGAHSSSWRTLSLKTSSKSNLPIAWISESATYLFIIVSNWHSKFCSNRIIFAKMWTKILLFYDAMNLSTAHLHTLKNGIFLLFCQQKPITHVKSCSSKIILCGMYFQMNNNIINPLPPFFCKYRFTFTEVCIEKNI